MKWRLVIPFCLILIFQTIFMMAFLSTGNVAQGLYQTELRSLKKDVENSGLLLEREVLQHWMNDIRSSVTIQTTIQSVLKEEGKKASDISHDWELNERIIGEIMPDVLELLRRSYGNSIYVVLDGPSAQQSAEGHQAGISVLDMDSSGLPRIIPISSFPVALLLSQSSLRFHLPATGSLILTCQKRQDLAFTIRIF